MSYLHPFFFWSPSQACELFIKTKINQKVLYLSHGRFVQWMNPLSWKFSYLSYMMQQSNSLRLWSHFLGDFFKSILLSEKKLPLQGFSIKRRRRDRNQSQKMNKIQTKQKIRKILFFFTHYWALACPNC